MQYFIEMGMMNMLVSDIVRYVDSIAPFDSADDWDNVGLLLGNLEKEVKRVLVSLDGTYQVLKQAKDIEADVVLTHHPIIFDPLKNISSKDLIYKFIKSDISVVCAHTNLDRAIDGVNDCLAKALDLSDIKKFEDSIDCGRIGSLSLTFSCDEFIKLVAKKLETTVRATRCTGKIKRVAVFGGAGEFAWKAAKSAGADAFVTGESKHHILLDAKNEDFCFVDAGHFDTEKLICIHLKNKLQNEFKNIDFFVANQSSPVCYSDGDKTWH